MRIFYLALLSNIVVHGKIELTLSICLAVRLVGEGEEAEIANLLLR